MRRLLFTTIPVVCGLFLLTTPAEAYNYGYLRIRADASTSGCNQFTFALRNSADSANATRTYLHVDFYVQNMDGSNRSHAHAVTDTATTSTPRVVSTSGWYTCAANPGEPNTVEAWVEIRSQSTGQTQHHMVNWTFTNSSTEQDNVQLYMLETATPTQTVLYPEPYQMIDRNANLARRFNVVTRSGGDIDWLWDDGIQYWTGSQWAPTNIGSQQLGNHGSPANLAAGNISRPWITVTTPAAIMDGTLLRWHIETLDQESPNLWNIWGNNESKYYNGHMGPSVYYLVADLETFSANRSGTLDIGQPQVFSAKIDNEAWYVTARASTARLVIRDMVDNSIVHTQEKGIPQINGSIGGSATVTFDPWTAGPGGYTAQICADIYDVVMEINETNNCTVLNQFLVSLEQPVITNIAATCTYATISWLPVSGARSYSLLVTGGEEHPSYYMSFSGWQNTSAFIITLRESSTYNYTLQAFEGGSSSGRSSPVNSGSFRTNTCSPPPRPGSPSHTFSCNSATLMWGASSGAESYTVTINGVSHNIGNFTSYVVDDPFTILPGIRYNWSVHANNSAGAGPATTVHNFTTPACKSLNIRDVSAVSLAPGGSSQRGTILEYSGPWTTSDQATLYVTAIQSGSHTCQSNHPPGSNNPVNGVSAYVNNDISGGSHTYNYPATGEIIIRADTSAANDTYTVCLGATSSAASNTIAPKAISVTVSSPAWLQISTEEPMGGSSPGVGYIGSGSIHSNGAMSLHIPPISHLFTDGVAGVVSADTSVDITSDLIMGPALSDWLIPNYGQITTDSFTALVAQMKEGHGNSIPSGTPSESEVAAICGSPSGTYIRESDGDVTVPALNLTTACNDRQLIFIVHGTLTVANNITDSSQSATLTFLVRDNINIHGSVTRVDGMYLFGGVFNSDYSNSATQQLVVHGSLLGLAGQSPSSSTGSFTVAGVSGFKRDLGVQNSTLPAEKIIYQPKYLFKARDAMGISTFIWTE